MPEKVPNTQKPDAQVKLVYYETFETKSEALSREYQIKQLSRQEKEKLIQKKDIV